MGLEIADGMDCFEKDQSDTENLDISVPLSSIPSVHDPALIDFASKQPSVSQTGLIDIMAHRYGNVDLQATEGPDLAALLDAS
eukprot:7412540-Karenia_brevis.AAC.1